MQSNSEIFLNEREEQVGKTDENFLYEEQESAYHEHQFLKTINEVDPSPATSEQLANYMIENLLEGNVKPLEFAVKRKCIEQAFDLVMNNPGVKNMVIEEINKYGKEGATALGAKLSLTNRPTYEYKADEKWSEIKERMAPLEAELKKQEELIKQACKSNVSLISEEGELLARPVPAPSTTSIVVSFKNKK